ncbi:MAG: hypothetical protein Q9187_009565 [Circinaria calcarea]
MNQEDLLRNLFGSEVVDTSRAEPGTPLGKQSYQDDAQLTSPMSVQQELSLTHLQREPGCPRIVDEEEDPSEHNTQIQSTPQAAKEFSMQGFNRSPEVPRESNIKQGMPSANYDDSTTSGSDDDLAVSTLPPRSRFTSTSEAEGVNKGHKKIGVLGGKQREPTPPPIITRPRPVGSNKPVGKIGRIGGKPKTLTTSEQNSDVTNPLPDANLGKNKASNSTRIKESSPDSDDGRKAGRSSEKPSQTPEAIRETSEERADRKRLQLKRELEEKAKVPTKKKRKF